MSTYDRTWNNMAKHTTEISRVWLYLTLFVTLVNLAAVITLSITYVRLSHDIEQNTNDLLQIWKTTFRNDIVNDLKEMMKSKWPLESESLNRHLRQNSGNELSEMFNQIAKSELDVLNKYCSNGSSICLPGEKGEPGIPGIPGPRGIQGVTGPTGATGAKGEQGIVGVPGNTGSPGIQGVAGPKGDTGLTGPNGEAGLKGELGMVGQQGPRGLTGEKGNAGVPGIPGSPGLQGVIGSKGDTGLTGPKGEAGLKGDPGMVGPQGPRGLTGEKGDVGISGPKGLQGEPGSIGPQGPQGPSGSMGEKGAKGDTYRAVSLAAQDCCANLAKPNFTIASEQLKVTEGSSVMMVCDATGSPKPSITWDPNPAGFDMTRYHVGNDFIVINGTKLTDNGLFTCIANSALGTDKKTFTLQVIKHITLLNQPQNYTVLLGNPVSLECNVEGPLNPQITWYHVLAGGLKLPVTTGITQIDHGSRLTITSFAPVDDGEYICEASNGVETVDFSAYLHFYGPPHIISPTSLMAMNGDQVVLVCRADAHPLATTSWTYRPGITNAYKDADGNLVILNVQNSDAGEYYCTATNQFGSDKATITLSVKSPPEVNVVPEKIQLTPSTANIVIECKVVGDDPLNVKWTKDGAEIISDGHHFILPGNVLLVNNPKVAFDIGDYMCTASNPLGAAVATSTVYDYKGTLHCSSIFADCNSTVCGGLCTTGCDQDLTPVYGDTQYSMDSAICKAAIHNGSIQSQGGIVIWKKTSVTGTYTGSLKNGITSQSGSTGGAVRFI